MKKSRGGKKAAGGGLAAVRSLDASAAAAASSKGSKKSKKSKKGLTRIRSFARIKPISADKEGGVDASKRITGWKDQGTVETNAKSFDHFHGVVAPDAEQAGVYAVIWWVEQTSAWPSKLVPRSSTFHLERMQFASSQLCVPVQLCARSRLQSHSHTLVLFPRPKRTSGRKVARRLRC